MPCVCKYIMQVDTCVISALNLLYIHVIFFLPNVTQIFRKKADFYFPLNLD